MRKCCKCKKEKAISEFQVRRRSSDGLSYECKSCASERKKKYWSRSSTDRRRERKLLSKYGISLDDEQEILRQQDEVCALCGEPPVEGERLHLDHDHETQRVRALVHRSCNLLLGFASDDIGLLAKAIAYLQKYKGMRNG